MTTSTILQKLRGLGFADATERQVQFLISSGQISRPEIESGRFHFTVENLAELQRHFASRAERQKAKASA